MSELTELLEIALQDPAVDLGILLVSLGLFVYLLLSGLAKFRSFK